MILSVANFYNFLKISSQIPFFMRNQIEKFCFYEKSKVLNSYHTFLFSLRLLSLGIHGSLVDKSMMVREFLPQM